MRRRASPRPADSLDKLPKPAGDPEGALRIYEYPHTNAQQPSPVAVVWPASRELDAGEQLLAELFFANLAGDASTNLYGLLIDSRSRRLDTGARSVGATVAEWGGHPVAIEISDVRPAAMSDDGLRAIRSVVVDEIGRIAAFADGSAELKAFNERIASRVAERERQALKFLGTPPGFGARDGNSDWANLLLQLERSPGERKSLVLKPEFAKVRALLDANRNVWREALARWNITGVVPYVVGARPSAALIAREQAEREARLAEETERLKQQLRHDRRAAGAGAPRRRRRCRAGADRQGHAGAAHAFRQGAADDAGRQPAVRVGAPGQRRAAGGLALRQHDRRDGGPGAAPGRRAARRAGSTCPCCPSCSPVPA